MSFVFQDLEIIKHPALFKPWHRPRVLTSDDFPSRRLIVWFTYWMDAQLFGLDAEHWRHTNMLLHVMNTVLLAFISPLAAVLFLVHPLTTMGHSYVAGRSGVLSAMFQIAAGLAVLQGWIIVSLLLAIIAILRVKEDSVIFVPMILILWWRS